MPRLRIRATSGKLPATLDWIGPSGPLYFMERQLVGPHIYEVNLAALPVAIKRTSAARLASWAGANFSSLSFLRMKASTGVRTQAASLTVGTAARTGLRNDHHVCAAAAPRLFDTAIFGQAAPAATHCSSVAISASASFGPGGIAKAPVRLTACTNVLCAALPATMEGPRVPPFSANSRE